MRMGTLGTVSLLIAATLLDIGSAAGADAASGVSLLVSSERGVTLRARSAPISALLGELERNTSVRIRGLPDDDDARVSVAVEHATVEEVLRRVLRGRSYTITTRSVQGRREVAVVTILGSAGVQLALTPTSTLDPYPLDTEWTPGRVAITHKGGRYKRVDNAPPRDLGQLTSEELLSVAENEKDPETRARAIALLRLDMPTDPLVAELAENERANSAEPVQRERDTSESTPDFPNAAP